MAFWRPQPPVAEDALREAAAEVVDAYRIVAECVVIIRALADRRIPDRTTDPPAERRVIGWLVSGRASPADVDGMEPIDFSSGARHVCFVMSLLLCEAHRDSRVGRPSICMLVTVLEHLCETEAAAEAAMCPMPALCPIVEIGLVAALGRAWARVADDFAEREAIVMAAIS